ncbi:cytochrome c oxidase subunit 3 [Chitinophaga sp. CF118]|uniref:cytochrome c oxidase subunit 3 n=1 Tax=Chitinophaga sp. CF118 TaxID=1884367 RepID=UPI0008E73E4E|nr:cytochrome c oxidase subunit 3 [Chitinophaga sp. CF118]SFD30704.1 cytochrome c oxidase subunit 3 [Chitinophaga sp. CF118]
MQAMSVQRNKIHPHKYSLWIAMGSITMMFIGFTSAYVVKRAQANWFTFQLPVIFWISTAIILSSSFTVQMAVKQFKNRHMQRYKQLITLTAVLGVAFAVCQWIGFMQMNAMGLPLNGPASVSFIYVIVSVHLLHVLGGVVALLIMFGRAFRTRIRTYSPVPIEVAATYWHFVDALWIYLLIFLSIAR